jgi:hypothetical protein
MNRIQKNKLEMLEKLKVMQENRHSIPTDSFPTEPKERDIKPSDPDATGTEAEDLSSEDESADPFKEKKVI